MEFAFFGEISAFKSKPKAITNLYKFQPQIYQEIPTGKEIQRGNRQLAPPL